MSLLSFWIIFLASLFALGCIIYLAVRLRLVLSSILLMIFILLIRSGVFIVTEGSQAVITRFGAIIGEAYTEPGLYLKVPFIWKVHYFDKRIYREGIFQIKMPTKDGYFITLDEVFNWRISDPILFLETMDSVDAARSFIRNNVSGGFKQAIAKHNLVDIIRSNEKNLLKKSYFTIEDLDKELDPDDELSRLTGVSEKITVGRSNLSSMIENEAMSYTHEFGVDIVGILIENISYELQVEERIYQRMTMERLREVTKLNALGRSRAQEIKGITSLKYQSIIAPAKRKAERIKGDAEAKTTELYAQAYNKNRSFYNYWRTLGVYSEILPNRSQGLILSTDSQFLKWIQKGNEEEISLRENLSDKARDTIHKEIEP